MQNKQNIDVSKRQDVIEAGYLVIYDRLTKIETRLEGNEANSVALCGLLNKLIAKMDAVDQRILGLAEHLTLLNNNSLEVFQKSTETTGKDMVNILSGLAEKLSNTK